jgi:hypothetical protein
MMIICVQIFMWIYVFSTLGMKWLGHRVCFCKELSKLFPTGAVSFYISNILVLLMPPDCKSNFKKNNVRLHETESEILL